ncbi:MAG: cytochrome c3 family protein [bacterium]
MKVWKRFFTVILFLMIAMNIDRGFAQEEQPEQRNSCIWCHNEIGDELAEPIEGMKHDIHADQGLSCVDCHGGDAYAGFDEDESAAMDPAKDYIGVPDKQDIPQFCARCHSDPNYMRQYNPRVSTDQFDRYKTSVHGQMLAKGDQKVATCVDCHGVHGILAVSDPRAKVYPLNIPATCSNCHADINYMDGYRISTRQVDDYKKGVHGIALLEKGDQAAPACNDCHGNHGAVPPGVPSIGFVCGQCHLNNSELFQASPHKVAFDEEELPECETCHDNHAIEPPTDAMLGVGEQSMCTDCHDDDSKGYLVAAVMAGKIDSLKHNIAAADSLVGVAHRAGMEVSEAQFNVNDANEFLIKARTMIHALSTTKLNDVTKPGNELATTAYEQGITALDGLQFRRKGLALSLFFILILAIGLYYKIKEVDQKTDFKEMRIE